MIPVYTKGLPAHAALGAMPELCNGGPVTGIVVSSGGAGYGFLVDDQGRLRQAGFGPDIDTHMQHLPVGDVYKRQGVGWRSASPKSG